MSTFLKKYAIFFILTIALILRTGFLDRLPTGISFDELEYVLNAKAVWATHSDIGGKWNPLSLTTPSCCFPQAELPSVIVSPFIGPFPFSLLFARLPYGIVSLASIVFLFLIAKRFFTKSQALFIAFFAAVTPWDIFFARTAYDAPLSTLFLLVAIYILLSTKKWKILLSAIPLFLSFFTYIGAKASYPFFLILLIPYTWAIFNKRKDTLWYIGLFLICLLPLIIYFLISHSTSSSRLSEISSPNQPSVVHDTNALRQVSLATPYTPLFVNKYTLFTFSSFEKYIGAFNPQFLFFHGDNKFLFTVWYTGAFYYTDIFFILFGFVYLFTLNKKVWAFFTGLVLLSPIPSVVSNVGTSYAIRSFPLLFFLCIFLGLGVYAVFSFFKNIKFKIFLSLLLAAVYSLQIANFVFIYAFVNPVANSESFAFSNRILAQYLALSPKVAPLTVVTSHPQSQLKQYIFYRGAFDTKAKGILQSLNEQDTFTFDSITFTTCKEYSPVPNETVIIESGLKCAKIPTANSLAITRLSDAGSVFTIFNDKLCSPYNLHPYPQHITFSDLAIQQLATSRFCEQFIMKF